MIITKTPFRISFFGGGTDIPAWFLEEGGQVLSTTIDKYCYVTARRLPPFFNHSIRLAYSKLEHVTRISDIIHPLIRTILQDFNQSDIEIHYDSDLPGRGGLGSSSSFGVGLVVALMGLKGKIISKKEVADKVIHYERNVLKENGGYQDQIAASFGGLNKIIFNKNGTYSVNPLPIDSGRLNELKRSLLLFYIPIKRFSSEVSLANDFNKENHIKSLTFIHKSVDIGISILMNGDLKHFGELLHETWLRKKEFKNVSNKVIDDIYCCALNAGALGGKLLGAGGGGFMLIYCDKNNQEKLKKALNKLLSIPFNFDSDGCRILYFYNANDPNIKK